MATDDVRMWRPASEDRVLLMAGRTRRYAIEPRGEYVFGVVAGEPMRSRRGRERRLVRPGELVAWDPSGAHAGAAVEARPWSSRVLVIEAGDLIAIAGDEEGGLPAEISFPEPVLADARLAHGFVRLHAGFERPGTRLERDERLAEWLRAVVQRAAERRPRRPIAARDERALRLACDYLGDDLARNVGLDELAAAAGVGTFRLIRLFRERFGLPPHAYLIARRIRVARRLLETGVAIADVAAATGFSDQSHLHRHFRRTLGLTPGEYRRRFRA